MSKFQIKLSNLYSVLWLCTFLAYKIIMHLHIFKYTNTHMIKHMVYTLHNKLLYILCDL